MFSPSPRPSFNNIHAARESLSQLPNNRESFSHLRRKSNIRTSISAFANEFLSLDSTRQKQNTITEFHSPKPLPTVAPPRGRSASILGLQAPPLLELNSDIPSDDDDDESEVEAKILKEQKCFQNYKILIKICDFQ